MSFNIGLSGLNAASEEINITGNNIANASTIGFKKSRTEFGDVFAASVGGGSTQQGSGVTLQNIAQDFSQGNISFTGNALDLAINGKGFFVLKGESGLAYTRAGAFGTDKDGHIINSSGERLQGFAPTANGDASGGGPLTDLVVTTGEISPRATTEIESVINLDASASPSSIVGTNLASNNGTSGIPRGGVQSARAAEVRGSLSTAGIDFSGTTAASTIGSFNISGGLNFASAGGNQGFSISVNGGAFQAIDLSGADTADEATLIAHVQTELDGALAPPNNVIVTAQNNRLVLTTAATGSSSNITIGNLVEGLAQNIVTAGTSASGTTAPPTGFRLTLDGDSRDIVIDQDYSNSSSAALALGGGSGSGNEALEDNIQSQIDGSPALAGRVNVSIDPDGTIRFVATDEGASNLQIDPIITTVGSVNFDQIVSFETARRQGSLDVANLDFSGGNSTTFTVTVGAQSQQISLNSDYSSGGAPAGNLGDHPESGLEALEDEIQSQINASTLPGDVQVSIGAGGDIVFEITDPIESALQVVSDSTTAQATGDIDISNGFNFDGGIGGTPYTMTIAYSVGGGPIVTSNPIALTSNYTNGTAVINGIQNAINTDTNFSFSPGNEEVVARIDPTTGFLVVETTDAGPASQISITVTAPAPLPSPSVFEDTTALPGGVQLGSGPAVDFNTFVSFQGSEIDNTGADALTNGFESEVIEVNDVSNNRQLMTVPAGSSANEVAQLFANVSGVTADATTVSYITATNRGDPENLGSGQSVNIDTNLPLRFAINGISFESAEADSSGRLADLASQINASTGNLSARIMQNAVGDDILEITENNGLDLTFSGGNNGLGSITVSGSVRDSVTGEPNVAPTSADEQQIANLSNLNQDSIVVGGIVDFTLDEGVTFTDAAVDANGDDIAATVGSIFGNISDASALTGTEFELNTFDPADPDTYFRSTALAIYDSVGNQHTLTQYFVKERDVNGVDVQGGVWSVYFQIDGEDVGFDPNNPDEASLARHTVIFDQNGRYDDQNDPIFITNWTPRDQNGNTTNGAAGPVPDDSSVVGEDSNSNFEIDLSEMTQFGGDFAVNSNVQDGYSKGQLVGLDIDIKGIIFARFSNGQSQILGEVALTDFADPSGLANIGGTRFAETAESGAATASGAGTAGLGVIQSGALEDSNVDLSDQLVKMIISQRNFQAAAQIIEAADSTTQTIINL
ncbi:MAG: flagellar hook-basal body complex protein [Pseudomonadales bacterium]|nr:flagellar hook-basal body complex protein [Pseudomonadales bacterium]